MARKLRQHDAPLSEDTTKQRPEWDEEACIRELQRLARANPERAISRNFFRNNSVISESTWNRYFGTFTEFKRQAGITLTRQQHHLEKQIAKHASVDHYRELNKERSQWGAKYVRANKTRWQTVMTLSDLHDHEVDRFFLEVALDTAKRVQPDVIYLVGDVFDLPEFGRYTIDPRQWDVVGRIQFVHEQILGPLRNATPDATVFFIEGNHEFRLLRHLADSSPALQAVLSDLHGFTVPKLLGLEEFELNYVAKADLAAYRVGDITREVGKNYHVSFDCFLAHHFPEGKNLGVPGVNGHHHRWQVTPMYNETFGSYEWVQLAAGHIRDAVYTHGGKWSNGFGLHHIDTHKKLVNHELISVTTQAVVGGKFYYREEA